MASTHDGPAIALASAEQQAEVIRLKRAGLEFREIGARLGISKSQVHRAFWAGLDRIVEPEVAAYRAEQLPRIELAREVVLDVMAAWHYVVSDGRIMRMPDTIGEGGETIPGEYLEDDSPQLAAVDRLVKLEDLQARLLGAYPEQKFTGDVRVNYTVSGIDPASLT